MNRFDTDFGEDGLNDRQLCNLHPFAGLYRFIDHTYEIVVWERNWLEAEIYCQRHGLELDGMIIRIENDPRVD